MYSITWKFPANDRRNITEVDMKLFSKPQSDPRLNDFISRLNTLTEQLQSVRSRFDYAVEPQQIDALIYEENAIQCRLSALYQEAKAVEIRLEIYENKKI